SSRGDGSATRLRPGPVTRQDVSLWRSRSNRRASSLCGAAILEERRQELAGAGRALLRPSPRRRLGLEADASAAEQGAGVLELLGAVHPRRLALQGGVAGGEVVAD